MKPRNAAVASLLAELREELLGAPRESTGDEHVRLMRFEEQMLAPAPRPVRRVAPVRARVRVGTRVRSAVTARPRRATALVASICVLFGSIGLSTAGALPGAIRHITDHITDSIVHTFGVPQAPKARESAQGPDARRASPAAPPDTQTSHPDASSAPAASVAAKVNAPASTSDGPVPSARPMKDQGVPAPAHTPTGTPAGPTPNPPNQDMQQDPGTPTGFPSDWRPRAIAAARAQMQTCSLADTLLPIGCPQQSDAAGGAPTDSVHWTVLNQPLFGAVAVADTTATGVDPKTAAGAQVTVFGLFQMDAAFTAGGDTTHTRYAFSGGIAEATMTWNGSGFDTVGFATGPVSQLPTGVHLPAFARSSSATDGAALAAVQIGFTACAAVPATPDASVPGCPQTAAIDPAATAVQWTLAGDPTQGAVVSFDPTHGDFIVSGTYAMTLSYDLAGSTNSVSVTGQYTATLSFDGAAFQLIAISGSPA